MSESGISGKSQSTGSGSWEQTKENIQPLSSGRRMVDIQEALPVRTAVGFEDQQRYEDHHLMEIAKMEQLANDRLNVDSDPILNYVNVVKYFQNHFPNMTTKVRNHYDATVRKIIQTFYGMDLYMNDERFASIFITGISSCLPTLDQIETLNKFLQDGRGVLVSEVYVHLAELYKGEGDTKKANEILKQGLNNKAQPREKLEEMLTHIQETWAKNFAKMLKNGGPTGKTEEGERGFAKDVPIYGENNEAISIRQNLRPAPPTNTVAPSKSSIRQQNNGTLASKTSDRFTLYNEAQDPSAPRSGESIGELSRQGIAHQRRLPILETKTADAENKLEAGRWNSKHNELQNPVIPQPVEKMKLFVESDAVAASANASTSVKSHKALQERKEDVCSLSELPLTVEKGSENEGMVAVVPPKKECIAGGSDLEVMENPTTKVDGYIMKTVYGLHMDGGPGNFFDGFIKYQSIPEGSSRVMEKCKRYMSGYNKWKKESKQSEDIEQLRREVAQLTESTQDLSKQLEKLKEQHKEENLQNQRRITDLEAQNEDLLNKLTESTTSKNRQDSLFQRTQYEKQTLENTVASLQQRLEQERAQHLEEIQQLKRKGDVAAREADLGLIKRIKQDEVKVKVEAPSLSRYDRGKKQSFVDISVCSRNATEMYSPSSTTTDTDQGTGESSRFRSGDTTIEQQTGTEQNQLEMTNRENQSVIGSSFAPNLDDEEYNDHYRSGTTVGTSIQPRKALAMVERPLEKDMMNITPAAANCDLDFEIPPPSCFGSMGFGKPGRAFNLYQSISDSMSVAPSNGGVAQARNDNLANNTRRGENVVKDLKTLSENMPPPRPLVVPTLNSDENAQPDLRRSEISLNNVRTEDENQFRRPALPSDENQIPTLPKPRRSILLGRPSRYARECEDSSDDDDDVILRRHQQTGVDLNISNLTMALANGPRPLVNSTPERERTLRDIASLALAPRSLSLFPDNSPPDTEETPMTDYPSTVAAPRGVSRYSILNEPPLNLSTIQETSRENRSRSTTSSSSGATTMSSTRFGGITSCSTNLYGNVTARSSSIPRSASRSTSSQNPNYNGYYSDTNAQH